MKAITTLLEAGHDVRLIHRDGLDMVEAKRTDAVTMSPKTAGAFVKELLQRQDEAVEWFREQLRAEWYREACGLGELASEVELIDGDWKPTKNAQTVQAIAIHELALMWDGDKCSDGFSRRDCIEALKLGEDVHDYVANKRKGIASHAGAGVRLSPAASGRLGRAVHSSESMALAA